jgi:2-methylcitrate dehydratase PrpD
MSANLQRWDGHVARLRDAIERHHRVAPAEAVSRHARLLLLDTLGCGLAGRRAPEVRALEASLADLEPGAFRFPGGRPLGVRAAAQILAIGPTWDEACEGHPFAHGRPGVPVVAALLPLALQRGAGLGDFLAALVMGYEIGARAGGWLRIPAGLHVDGNWPAIGAAAAVARLLGLPPEGILRAVNIAACQLGTSLYLPVRTGATVRNVYLARSALLGMDAAFAAQAGIEAPAEAMAHYAEHFSRAEPQPLPPASEDLILGAYLKPFAAVRHVHYGAIAVRAIRAELDGRTQDIRAIALQIYDEALTYCGNRDPRAPLTAQFSLSFGVAAMLRFGVLDASCYDEPRFSDPELRRLEKLVEIVPDPDLTARRQRGARLTVTTDRAHAGIVDAAHPELFLDQDGAVAKFALNARAAVPAAQARSFCAAVLAAPPAISLGDLWQQLERT